MSARVAVLPPAPLLLPTYSSRIDPAVELRDACLSAVSWLAYDAESVVVLADPLDDISRTRGMREALGMRVARSLLSQVAFAGTVTENETVPDLDDMRLLVMANGSARRSEKAPGHLDPRSFAFDERIGHALATGNGRALAATDGELGKDLLACGIEPLKQLGRWSPAVTTTELLLADDPFGVQYWVATWMVG